MIEGSERLGYTLTCDECGEEIDFYSFMEAVDYKKENGWKSRKDRYGDWEDICPNCTNYFRRINDRT